MKLILINFLKVLLDNTLELPMHHSTCFCTCNNYVKLALTGAIYSLTAPFLL